MAAAHSSKRRSDLAPLPVALSSAARCMRGQFKTILTAFDYGVYYAGVSSACTPLVAHAMRRDLYRRRPNVLRRRLWRIYSH